MQDLRNKVLDEIKNKNITPKPRWQFVGRDLLFWGAFAVSVGVGSVAFGAMLDRITSIDWDIYPQLGRGPILHVFMSFPYLWVVVVALFSLLAIYNFRHTKEGYRYRPIVVITTSIIISIVGGTALFFAGCGGPIDERVAQRPPLAPLAFEHPRDVWGQPERGLLAGEILAIDDEEKSFHLRDLTGEPWQVRYWRAVYQIPLFPSARVKIIGEIIGDHLFEADQIRPWRGMMRPGPGF